MTELNFEKRTKWQRIKGKFYFKFISPLRTRRFWHKVTPLLERQQYLNDLIRQKHTEVLDDISKKLKENIYETK